MTRTCLVSLYGNGNALAALSAVRWYNALRYPNEKVEVVTVVNTPGLSDELIRESGSITTRIISSQGWAEPIFLSDQEMTRFTPSIRNGVNVRTALKLFRRRIQLDHVDEIFYAHDIGGSIPGLAMNAFPKAERILFGDGLGSIYNKIYHMALINGATIEEAKRAVRESGSTPSSNLKSRLIRFLKELILGHIQPYQADKAVLVLPMDQTGTSLNNVELIVVPKEIVQTIISDCVTAIPELMEYSTQLLKNTSAPHALILLENLADANLSSAEKEVDFYEEIIRKNVPEKSTVFIKAHPLSKAPIHEILRSRIQPDFQAEIISAKFARYPIELWSELIKQCEIIGIAYANVTLSYLYNKETVFALTEPMIEAFIHPQFWGSFKDAALLYSGQLINLKHWDGRSMLWKGSVE